MAGDASAKNTQEPAIPPALREALEQYADSRNWSATVTAGFYRRWSREEDGYKLARAALAQLEAATTLTAASNDIDRGSQAVRVDSSSGSAVAGSSPAVDGENPSPGTRSAPPSPQAPATTGGVSEITVTVLPQSTNTAAAVDTPGQGAPATAPAPSATPGFADPVGNEEWLSVGNRQPTTPPSGGISRWAYRADWFDGDRIVLPLEQAEHLEHECLRWQATADRLEAEKEEVERERDAAQSRFEAMATLADNRGVALAQLADDDLDSIHSQDDGVVEQAAWTAIAKRTELAAARQEQQRQLTTLTEVTERYEQLVAAARSLVSSWGNSGSETLRYCARDVEALLPSVTGEKEK